MVHSFSNLDSRGREKVLKPTIGFPPFCVIRIIEHLFTTGMIKSDVNGLAFTVTDSARSLADSFTFQNKIGTDVALQALRVGRDSRWITMGEIRAAEEQTRMVNVAWSGRESLI